MNINGITGFFNQALHARGQAVESIARQLIDKRDKDGDGKLSLEELGNRKDRFGVADSNRDGYLNFEELLVAAQTKNRAEEHTRAAHQKSLQEVNGAAGIFHSAAHSLDSVGKITAQIFTRKDTDNDGLLSTAEIGKRADLFSFVDTDKDGFISREEANYAISHRKESYSRLQEYAEEKNMNVKQLLMENFDLSDHQAEKIARLLEESSLSLTA